jgi:type II secretory pathway pseudopilin PulG
MLIFRDLSVLMIFGFLAAAFVGINLLNRFFQIQAQQKAEAVRKAEKAQEKAEREASRAARATAPDGARRPVSRQAGSAAQAPLRAQLINQGIIRPAIGDDDHDAGQPSDLSSQPAVDPQIGVPAI